MATTTPNHPDNGSGVVEDSYMDDLEDYDFPELDTSIREIAEIPKDTPATGKRDNLGIDDEVKVRTKRVNVKLDETRLLGAKGIPKLRKEAPKLRFKGKGHEYRDASRLLSYYQLWADDLFKKAKFRETLSIMEKLGHTRTIRNERESYIMESKKAKQKDEDIVPDVERQHDGYSHSRRTNPDAPHDHPEGCPTVDRSHSPGTPRPPGAPNQDSRALFLGANDSDDDYDAPDEAELDALMNSANIEELHEPVRRSTVLNERDEFEDEMEALMDTGMEF